MQETVSLPDLLKELREIRQKNYHIEEIIEDLLEACQVFGK